MLYKRITMGNYLSNTQIFDRHELPKPEIYKFPDIPEKNIRQQEITTEFYKSRRNNKFANLENAINLK